MSRKKFLDSLYQRVRRGHIVQPKKTIETAEVDSPLNLRMLKQRLQLGAKINLLAGLVEIQRLDAHAVAREHQAFLRLRPQRDSEHPPKPRKALGVPLQE